MDYKKYLMDNPDATKLMDKVTISKRSWEYISTDFLTPGEQEFLKSICVFEDMNVSFYGGKGEFERAVAVIGNLEYEGIYPVNILKVDFNSKFEKLTHRDYLGSILSLGIKRDKIGDINVYDDGAEIYICKDISDYVLYNLSKIKHAGIRIKQIQYDDSRVRNQEYKEMKLIASSLRLDCVISSILNIARNASASLIKAGDVKVNHLKEYEISTKVDEKTIISIKGYGRYTFDRVLGKTKSDRLTILVNKYL